MKEYKEYYIAFIDVLGFKDMVKNMSCDDIFETYIAIDSFARGAPPIRV